jgi:transcriptional regulator with PAS, ATPase and Fis domain
MGAKRRLTESEERIGRLDSPETLSRTAAPWVSRSGSRPVARVVLDAPPPRGPGSRPLRHLRSEWAFDQFGVVTVDSAVLRLLEEVERLAKSRAPVLILGESGTGKELIAHAVHRHSGRPGQFLAINCAALPREVIQSELFGHVAGSFTGAARDKAGLFEVCARGTVFLDEIGEMPLDLQSHLLRFLESGESRRVGALKTAVVDTRVVAATNREAATLKRGEGFRKDLYYRLAHAVIELPPLRQRGPRDIELLAHHFLALACSEEGRQVSLSPAAIERMAGHSWPGNVREMKAEIFRRVVLARDGHVISPDELHLDDSDTPNGLDEELEQAERDRIQAALRQYPNRTEAARALGIPRTTLINRIRRMRLQG